MMVQLAWRGRLRRYGGGVDLIRKCNKCGFRTGHRRKFKKHVRECNNGQSETRPPEGQEAKEELVEAQVSEEPVEAEVEEITDEGIDYEEMTVLELRELAREEKVDSIYSKNKAELIKTLKAGEK